MDAVIEKHIQAFSDNGVAEWQIGGAARQERERKIEDWKNRNVKKSVPAESNKAGYRRLRRFDPTIPTQDIVYIDLATSEDGDFVLEDSDEEEEEEVDEELPSANGSVEIEGDEEEVLEALGVHEAQVREAGARARIPVAYPERHRPGGRQFRYW